MKSVRTTMALAAVMCLAMSACSDTADPEPADDTGPVATEEAGSSEEASSEETGGEAGGSTTEPGLLGIVTITATDSNNARVIQGATAAAEEAGWTVEVVDAAGNADTANSAMVNFVSKDAGMIFDLVFPTSSLGAGLAATQDAGIPVATWGGGLGDGVVMTTGGGAPFAEPATQAMLDHLDGEGAVLALTYRTGEVCRQREELFDQMLADYPDIQVQKEEVNIPGFLQDGANYANAWLAGHQADSENLAIWGCWEDPTLGAISALQQQSRSDVKTYGINGSAAAIEAVQNGTLTATVYEDGVAEGALMFDTTLEAIEAGDSWEPVEIDVPGILVTEENVEQFVQDHPEALQ